MKLEPVVPSLSCQGAPSGEAAEQAVALGKALAQEIAS